MNAGEVIDSYARDVAYCLPRKKRNDVAFELRALLSDELAARAQAAGRAPDKAMAMDLLKGFGRPAEAAARYHQRPAVIEPADTHHFLIWALGGAVCVSVLSALSPGKVPGSDLFLQWLGVLVVVFGLMGWWRRRHPNTLGWRPKRGQDSMPRPLAVLALTATLIFPVFMYTAPQTFVKVMFLGAFSTDRLELTEPFRQSWQRVAAIGLLFLLAAIHAAVALQGGRRPLTGRLSAAAHGLLGLLFVAHAAPMASRPGGATFAIFESPATNSIAMPIFGLVGAFLVLCAIYDMYWEWTRITPAPALDGGGV